MVANVVLLSFSCWFFEECYALGFYVLNVGGGTREPPSCLEIAENYSDSYYDALCYFVLFLRRLSRAVIEATVSPAITDVTIGQVYFTIGLSDGLVTVTE
jgi:hypothetical protein